MRFPRLLFGVLLLLLLALTGALIARAETEPAAPAKLPSSVQLRNVQFGLLLRPQDANAADGTPLVLYPAQPWRCMTWTVYPSHDSSLVASLKNRFTSKAFVATATGVIEQGAYRADNLWKFEPLPNGKWRILDPASGKALGARDEKTVALDPWRDAPTQQWEVLPAPAVLTM